MPTPRPATSSVRSPCPIPSPSPHPLPKPSTNLASKQTAKSKKQRRLALKRQRQLEAKLLASGDLEALVPKVPLHKQTVNLPAAEGGTLREALEAVDRREELRKAMRKERRAKIKESNYLKTM